MLKNNLALIILLSLAVSNCGLTLAAPASKNASGTTKQKRTKQLTQQEAVKIVAIRPEVVAWKKSVDAAAKTRGVSAHIEADRKENNEYIIHVYELVPDDAESSHSATFNWYHVNQKTGKVTKEF